MMVPTYGCAGYTDCFVHSRSCPHVFDVDGLPGSVCGQYGPAANHGGSGQTLRDGRVWGLCLSVGRTRQRCQPGRRRGGRRGAGGAGRRSRIHQKISAGRAPTLRASPLISLGAVPHHHLALSVKELTYSSNSSSSLSFFPLTSSCVSSWSEIGRASC